MNMIKPGPAIGETITEVQGIFPSDAALQEAIGQLSLVGFDRADFSLPIAAPRPHEATPEQGAANPHTEADGRQMRTMHTSMAASAGALAAAGITVATGGAAAVVIGAAVAAGAGAGILANAASSAADRLQRDERDVAAAQGTLVLSVRTPNPAKQEEAILAMRRAGATTVAPVSRVNGEILTA